MATSCAALQPSLLLELRQLQPTFKCRRKGFHLEAGLLSSAQPKSHWLASKRRTYLAGCFNSTSQQRGFTKFASGGVRCQSTMPTGVVEPAAATAQTAAPAVQNEADLFYLVTIRDNNAPMLSISKLPPLVLRGRLEVGDAQPGVKGGNGMSLLPKELPEAPASCALLRAEDLPAMQEAFGRFFCMLAVTPWTAVINSLSSTPVPRKLTGEGRQDLVEYQLLEYEYVENVIEKRGPFREAHLKLAAKKCILGGPKGDPIDGAFLLFAPGGDDKNVAAEFVSQDPYVAAGLITSYWIRPWKIRSFDRNCFRAPEGKVEPDAQTDTDTHVPSSQLSSMSGFSRVDGRHRNKSWSWEVKSVNGRGLDVRVRVPSAYSSLEQAATAAAADRFTRGSVSCFLEVKVEKEQQDRRLVVDEDAMLEVIAAYERVSANSVAGSRKLPEQLDYGHLLRIPGIVRWEEPEETEEEREELLQHMTDSLQDALDRLLANRASEGDRLRAVLSTQVAELEALVDQAAEAAQERIPQLKERLQKQVSELVETSRALDPGRLEQEVALLTTKLDIREEVDRLRSHIVAAKALLDGTATPSASPRKRTSEDDSHRPVSIGRQLDFLCQEFTRECSTICSKSSDVPLTQLALQMRGVSEQIKEQAANVR